MTTIINDGQPIAITGKSGNIYVGRIYDKQSKSHFVGQAIICLTNSFYSSQMWNHGMNSIFHTDDVQKVFDEFKERGDISHIIIVPQDNYTVKKPDAVDDLIRSNIHG